MYDELGIPITYSAKEKYFDGFVTIYDNVAPYADEDNAIFDGGTIINRKIREADFKVRKVWYGLGKNENPPKIRLILYCNGEQLDVPTPNPDKDGWYKYYGLPDHYKGEPAVYHVLEATVGGFETMYLDTNGWEADCAYNGYTILNSRLPGTGDSTPLMLLGALAVLSAAGILVLVRRKKKI